MKQHAIIAGTEKAGTTSVFQYLSAHPSIQGSIRKETDYFRSAPFSIEAYERCFPAEGREILRLEASPGYLADSAIAAPAIHSLLPDAKLIFILRDPIERLLSSFLFHKSRLLIPRDLSFDSYISLCQQFESGARSAEETGLIEWVLRVPEAGLYARHLQDYSGLFSRDQILITSFSQLAEDPGTFMVRLSRWLDIDESFYRDFTFESSNVTFQPRILLLQKIGLKVNDLLEPLHMRYPAIKRRLLVVYKFINGGEQLKSKVSPHLLDWLVDYYAADVRELEVDWKFAGPDFDRWRESSER